MCVNPKKVNSFLGLVSAGNICPPRWMNDKSISFSEMTSLSANTNWPQVPSNMVRRVICQYANSIEDVYGILNRLGGSTGWNNMICEGKGDDPHGTVIETSGTEIAQREENPEFPNVVWSTNHFNCYPGWQGYEGYNMVPGQIKAYKNWGMPIGPHKGESLTWEDIDTLKKWRASIICPRYEEYRSNLKKWYGKIDMKIAIDIQSSYELTVGRLKDMGLGEIKKIQLT